MRESTSARGPLPRAAGIVDSLSAGFGVVNAQPWVIAIPILLDLLFLFGPRVSIAPLVSQVVTTPSFASTFGAEAPAAAIALAEESSLLGLLSPGGTTLPTIVPGLNIARGSFTLLDSLGVALLIGIAALIIGSAIGSVYQAIIAQQARDGELSYRALPREAAVGWLRIVALAVIVLSATVMVTVPFGFVAALASLAGAGLQGAVVMLVGTLALLTQFYLFFASDAIFVGRVGPIQAIRDSIAVVQGGVWSALLLLVLITAVLIGMSQLWSVLGSVASWGIALGIVGNAYIASGLAAAKMLFYQERIELLLARQD